MNMYLSYRAGTGLATRQFLLPTDMYVKVRFEHKNLHWENGKH
jgi:hypothetical protein